MPIAFTEGSEGVTVQFGFQIPEVIAKEVFPGCVSDWRFYHEHTAIATSEGTTKVALYAELIAVMANQFEDWSNMISSQLQEREVDKRKEESDG